MDFQGGKKGRLSGTSLPPHTSPSLPPSLSFSISVLGETADKSSEKGNKQTNKNVKETAAPVPSVFCAVEPVTTGVSTHAPHPEAL